jgi:predicted N-acetyltransferase YhbS
MRVEMLTAETPQGRQALDEVMRHSYAAAIDEVPAAWARVCVVDGVPVAFIIVDPDRRMEFPGEDLHYAFICDVATREDRRREGHFNAIMRDTFAELWANGVALVVTHGRYQLYRRFGFDVFTHHSGLFITPDKIERSLGAGALDHDGTLQTVEAGPYYQPDLLVISDVRVATLPDCKLVLRGAAVIAREQGKGRILFEHPAAPSYGSSYPIYASLRTRFTALALACGAQWLTPPADPESGAIPDADWIKVLDTPRLLQQATRSAARQSLRPCAVSICTDAGDATIETTPQGLSVCAGASANAAQARWPAAAVAQLVTGFKSARDIAAQYGTPLPPAAAVLLDHLFPRRWRLSRNESWTYPA